MGQRKKKPDNKKKIQDVINAQENKDINRSGIWDIKNGGKGYIFLAVAPQKLSMLKY